jgi:hypothetical protein
MCRNYSQIENFGLLNFTRLLWEVSRIYSCNYTASDIGLIPVMLSNLKKTIPTYFSSQKKLYQMS